jgi:RNA polymerase sigma-70 factor (ECF subfamily)
VNVFAEEQAQPLTMAEMKAEDRVSQAEFEAFYLRTSKQLHGYLCRLTRDPATADELLQEAYIRTINAPAIDALQRKAYLYKTATNLLRDRWRRQKREREWSAVSDFDQQVHQNLSLSIDMESVFGKLSVQERAILWLAHVEELSHQEIAAVLGVKEQSVRVMVFRAREKAKGLLQRAGLGAVHE